MTGACSETKRTAWACLTQSHADVVLNPPMLSSCCHIALLDHHVPWSCSPVPAAGHESLHLAPDAASPEPQALRRALCVLCLAYPPPATCTLHLLSCSSHPHSLAPAKCTGRVTLCTVRHATLHALGAHALPHISYFSKAQGACGRTACCPVHFCLCNSPAQRFCRSRTSCRKSCLGTSRMHPQLTHCL